MAPNYKTLAKRLNQIPNGYPETKSGVELEILKKLFTPDEAAIACKLNLSLKTADDLSADIKVDKKQVKVLLKSMVKKGLISLEKKDRQLGYKLMPFVVGFYEAQNGAIDEELAELFEKYYHEASYQIMTAQPSVHRVIPVEQNIPVNIEVMPYEKASTYIEKARAWGVLKCICRVQKQLVGDGCHHSLENCLVFSTKENHFARSTTIRAISKQEAYEILQQARAEGLVHSTSNTQDDVTYICNCCTCSCGVMRTITEHNHHNVMAASDFLADVDIDSCTGCNDCIETCQFGALSLLNDECLVDKDKCVGCGICIDHCPTESMTLIQKTEMERIIPPKDELEWYKTRSDNRGIEFDADF